MYIARSLIPVTGRNSYSELSCGWVITVFRLWVFLAYNFRHDHLKFILNVMATYMAKMVNFAFDPAQDNFKGIFVIIICLILL